MRDYRATRFECMVSDIRYMRYYIGDILAALATVGILAIIPIIAAAF